MTEPIWTKGRVIGVAAIVAVPFVAVWMLGGLATGETPVVRPWEQPFRGERFRPEPLPEAQVGQGLGFVAGRQRDARAFTRLALHVPAGRPAADFLVPGPFEATFRGTLRIPRRDRYRFSFVGTGTFELVIGEHTVVRSEGEPVTGERLRLRKGEHPFTAIYKSPESGDATMRVYRLSRDFGREPIPSRALTHGEDPVVAAFAELRRGRELVQELRCASCHERAVVGRGGPGLFDAGTRLRRDWVAAWIEDPQQLRSHATMPKLIQGPDAAAKANDLAAYLATLGQPGGAFAPTEEERTTGGEIFVDFGCLACHTLPNHADPTTAGDRISLAHVAAKWQPEALVAFLQRPHAHYPDIRMPDYGFSAADARSVAGFLVGLGSEKVASRPAGDAARGEALAAEFGCANCHGMPAPSRMEARPIPLANDGGFEGCSAAEYGLPAADLQALRAYLTHKRSGRFTALEAAQRTLRSHRCVHCHAHDGVSPMLESVLGEGHAIVPPDPAATGVQRLPDLTVAGAKLRSEWLMRWLDGEVSPRPRPWLTTPMPTFQLDSKRMAKGLAAAHGFPPTGVAKGVLDGTRVTPVNAPTEGHGADLQPGVDLAGIGQRLLPQNGGFGCTTCHNAGEVKADSVFEAPGIDLQFATDRLRKEFYHRWMFDPTRVDPATKMTRFLDPDGTSGLTDVLGGQGWAQIEAIWRYIESLKPK